MCCHVGYFVDCLSCSTERAHFSPQSSPPTVCRFSLRKVARRTRQCRSCEENSDLDELCKKVSCTSRRKGSQSGQRGPRSVLPSGEGARWQNIILPILAFCRISYIEEAEKWPKHLAKLWWEISPRHPPLNFRRTAAQRLPQQEISVG